MVVGQEITVGGEDNPRPDAARPALLVDRSDMRDGGPDPLECVSDARRIGIERVVGGQNIKWHVENVLPAKTTPTRSNGGGGASPTARWRGGCAMPILLPIFFVGRNGHARSDPRRTDRLVGRPRCAGCRGGGAGLSLAGGRIDRRISLDFSISRGEEGGPVLDAAGHLLGMSTGGPGGRALVIPAATIERVLDPLLATGRIDRGWLGLALHPVTLPEATKIEGGQQRGLMVMQVAQDGPAAKAGVLAGDILVAVDGAPASRPMEIARQFGPESIGKQVELRVVRSGAPRTLAATITARPA